MNYKLCGRHLIGGKWTASCADSFDAINPSTGGGLPTSFFEATNAEVDAALDAATAASAKVAERDPRWPMDLLEAIAAQIEALGEELLERGEQETALPRPRLTGERARTCGQLRMFAGIVREGSWVEAVIDTADPNRQPLAKPDLRRMFVPRGPVAVFGASNFPFAFGVCGGDTASAFAAGNPVIVKGHPSHPGTNEMFAGAVLAALQACGLPAGLFALLQGRRHELSGALVTHRATTAVGFTGSQRAGRSLFDLASKRDVPIPVYAEMGSVNPVVLMPGAVRERAERIAADLSASMLQGCGQFCTKPGVTLVIGDDGGRLLTLLTEKLCGASQAVMLNHGLRESFANRVAEIAAVPGVTVTVTAQRSGHAATSAALFETDAGTFLRERVLHEEAFGPGGIIVHCADADEARACLESLGGNLTGTLHIGDSDDRRRAGLLLRSIEHNVGRVIVNGYPTGVEVGRAIVHGGPYPATTDAGTTSVGTAAIRRFVRPVAYQNTPSEFLPPALRDENPLGIMRLVDGEWTKAPVTRRP